jgi:hypothetical protein
LLSSVGSDLEAGIKIREIDDHEQFLSILGQINFHIQSGHCPFVYSYIHSHMSNEHPTTLDLHFQGSFK